MKGKISYIFIFVIFITLCGVVFYFYKIPPPKQVNKTHQKCPDGYPDTNAGSAEYLADFNEWTNAFYEKNPNAGLSGWSKARYQFWVDNNCAESIRRYSQAKNGTADAGQMKLIEKTIQQAYEQSKQ